MQLFAEEIQKIIQFTVHYVDFPHLAEPEQYQPTLPTPTNIAKEIVTHQLHRQLNQNQHQPSTDPRIAKQRNEELPRNILELITKQRICKSVYSPNKLLDLPITV